MTMLRIVTVVVLMMCAVAQAQDHEKKIKRSSLPPAVEKTVAEQSEGATIRGLSREQEKGQTFYEAEFLIDGHSRDVLMDETGAEQVPLESLPAAVKDGLETLAGKDKILGVESLTKKGKLVAYEAKVLSNGKKSELQVGPDGKPLDHEE
jgi:predicted aspartyl protease